MKCSLSFKDDLNILWLDIHVICICNANLKYSVVFARIPRDTYSGAGAAGERRSLGSRRARTGWPARPSPLRGSSPPGCPEVICRKLNEKILVFGPLMLQEILLPLLEKTIFAMFCALRFALNSSNV